MLFLLLFHNKGAITIIKTITANPTKKSPIITTSAIILFLVIAASNRPSIFNTATNPLNYSALKCQDSWAKHLTV